MKISNYLNIAIQTKLLLCIVATTAGKVCRGARNDIRRNNSSERPMNGSCVAFLTYADYRLHVLHREEILQHIKGNGHQQQLPPGNVLFQKANIPWPERTMVVIGVLFCSYMSVMLVMPWKQTRIPVVSEQEGSYSS